MLALSFLSLIKKRSVPIIIIYILICHIRIPLVSTI